MSKFIFVTNHAIERFKDRFNLPNMTRDTCIRVLQALVHKGVDFGGNIGTDTFKLGLFKSYTEMPDTEIVLVIGKDYDEEKKRSSLVVKTVLTKDQALANMSMTSKDVRQMSKQISL